MNTVSETLFILARFALAAVVALGLLALAVYAAAERIGGRRR